MIDPDRAEDRAAGSLPPDGGGPSIFGGCLFAAGLIWTLCCGLCTSCTVLSQIGVKPPYLYSGLAMQVFALELGLPNILIGLVTIWFGRRQMRK